ncbi:metal ABC transporter permease [Alienimonas chondri]|uniref:Manganese transport system membrane protein MntB n=1 Tax=Alienimonas chondri TaxID=2681879 RepID=A0ABX1VIR3_9PLAN|nr:metal ABC transporter permease [Alienimonas chondri]NNJ27694.1 Manganese transport system membrane protein MntB [Alienimonas chondri]
MGDFWTYNTRIVLAGATLLGVTGGVVGVFALLRKRALVADVVGHAALPGVAIAFLASLLLGGPGRDEPLLMLGAAVAGTLGAATLTLLGRFTQVKEDAAMAIVLGVFFGLGAALFRVVQNAQGGGAAGLNTLLFGKIALLVRTDVLLFAALAAAALAVCVLLRRELALLCFDPEFSASIGRPVLLLDLALSALIVSVAVTGMQSVGLILVVATLVTPAAAARFWTDRLGPMLWLSGTIGGLAAAAGVLISASGEKLAAGPLIVLCGSAAFGVSLLFGPRRGVVARTLRERSVRQAALKGGSSPAYGGSD